MKPIRTALAAGALLLTSVVGASAQYYTINGVVPPPDVEVYLYQNGLPPGHYWLDNYGNWGVVGNPTPYGNIYGASNPTTGAYEYYDSDGSYNYGSRSGSGSVYSDGSSSHYIDRSITPGNNGGFSVGQDSNGCIYAGDWSNC